MTPITLLFLEFLARRGWTIGVRLPVGDNGRISFPSSRCADRLWGLLNLLSNGYRGLFPPGKAAGVWSWPLNLLLVPRLRMRGAMPPLPHTSSWCVA